MNRSKRALGTVCAGLVVCTLLALGLCGTAGAFESFTLAQLTTNDQYDGAPQVSGDRVVWYGRGGADGGADAEVFTWTPGGGVVQLTTNLESDEDPQVSGHRVVWRGTGGSDDGSDHEIFTWTPGGGVVQLTLDNVVQQFPQVSGDRVVWCAPGGSDGGADPEVFTWTPGGGVVQLTVNGSEDAEVTVSGDRVVWLGFAGADPEVFTWTPAAGTTQITTNSDPDYEPRVSGDRVVWISTGGIAPGDDYEIFTWTPTGGIVQISADDLTEDGPSVSGDRVVWSSHSVIPGVEVLTWTPVGGIVQLTGGAYTGSDPHVCGDRVVWADSAGGDHEIMTWTPTGGTSQISTDSDQDYYPRVSGDRVVWMSTGGIDLGSDYEIYTAVRLAPVTYTSIRGSDRFDTALKLSQAMFPAALPDDSGVVLAPGWESYQEALCGAPLAAAYGGPVLLSSKTVLYSGVAAELTRLDPDHVFCIGLTGTTVADAVKALLPTASVTSINGQLGSVYDMSRKVAGALGTRVDATGGDISAATGILTIGSNFPDAIGVSALACAQGWPIILTDVAGGPPPVALNPSAAATFSDLGITTALKAGTYAELPDGVTGLANFSGADRYYTCANAAAWAKTHAGLTFTHTALTTGDKFPDALAGGPYVAQDQGMLLLSPTNGPLPAVVGNLISANRASVEHFTFIACIEPVVGQVKALLD